LVRVGRKVASVLDGPTVENCTAIKQTPDSNSMVCDSVAPPPSRSGSDFFYIAIANFG